jgi:hypothetical protein
LETQAHGFTYQEVIMNRTTAIVITVVSALLCACPGLALIALGAMAAFGSQVPEVMAQNTNTPEEVLLGSGMFICFGAVLILIPVIVGVLSIRFAKPSEPRVDGPIPPA